MDKKGSPLPTTFDAFKAHPCPTCKGTGRVGELMAGGVAAFDGATGWRSLTALCSRRWWEPGFECPNGETLDSQRTCDRPKGHDGACADEQGHRAPDGPIT